MEVQDGYVTECSVLSHGAKFLFQGNPKTLPQEYSKEKP